MDEIVNMTMEQLSKYYGAAIEEDEEEFKTNVSATLLGSRGAEEDINKVFRR